MSGEPQIISNYDAGHHNNNMPQTIERLTKEAAYKDCRTIIIAPTVGKVPARVALSWQGLAKPPNSNCPMVLADGAEVGEAYSRCIEGILAHPDMSKYPYMLTVEHDNILPYDGLLKLIQHMESHPEFDVIGALYFTKGNGGVAQCWGDIKDPVLNFRPQRPIANVLDSQLIEVYGTGMGMTMYRLKMFRDKNLRKPWFATKDGFSQDLYFASDAKKNGYRFAVALDVKVSHLDYDGKFGPPGKCW